MKRDPRRWKYKRTFKVKNKVENMEPCMSQLGNLNYGLVVEKDVYIYYAQLFTMYRLIKKKLKKKKSILK